MTELKLEVGKKYILIGENIGWGATRFPLTFIANLNKIGIEGDAPFLFIEEDGSILYATTSEIQVLKEYREPFKNTIEGFLIKQHTMPAEFKINEKSIDVLEELLKDSEIVNKTAKSWIAGNLSAYAERMRITIEQLPETD